jgi:hypothetical protein
VLARLQREHPEIEIELVASNELTGSSSKRRASLSLHDRHLG